MSKKKKKKNLRGIEHLYQNIALETSTSGVSDSSNSNEEEIVVGNGNSFLKKELLVIIVIMIVLFGILGIILYLDKTSDFLRILAEKLTNLY